MKTSIKTAFKLGYHSFAVRRWGGICTPSDRLWNPLWQQLTDCRRFKSRKLSGLEFLKCQYLDFESDADELVRPMALR